MSKRTQQNRTRHRGSGPVRLPLVPPEDRRRRTPKPIGMADAGPAGRVRLGVADARHHLHVAGHTGAGKSTHLVNMVLADAMAGRGVAVLDPKGDLVTDILERLPAECGTRLVLIDPAEHQAPASLNVLDTRRTGPELVTENLVGVLHRLFADAWGPRIEDTLRASVRTLAGYSWATLADVPLLLTNAAFRARLTARARAEDPEGLGGFWDAYERLSPAAAAQAGGSVLSKLRAVLARSFVSGLFGTAVSSFDPADILNGGILLARLPKGLLGEDACRLVGSLLLASLWQATTSRAEISEEQRLDAAVYVDEAHNFLHLPIGLEDVLAEARGYRLSLVLAHQHLDQLPRTMAEAIHANARNKIFFTLSPNDAKRCAEHVGPYLAQEDLARLELFQIACRLVVNGANTTGFTAATEPAPEAIPGRAEQMRAAARAHGLSHPARERLHQQRRMRTANPPSDSLADSPTDSVTDSPTDLETASESDTPDPGSVQVTPQTQRPSRERDRSL